MTDLPFPTPGSEPALPVAPVQPDVETTAQRQAIAAAGRQLRSRAFLHDDPDAYAAGVRDALIEVDEQLDAFVKPPAPTAEL